MGTFIEDGDSQLPGIKADTRPATVPPAPAEWAASDANKIREALRDVRAAQLGVQTGFVNPDLAEITATGSTEPRMLSTRFADTVNVKDHGAVGDGVTDDTAAIKAAICAAIGVASLDSGGESYADVYGSTRQKRVVYLPEGRYRVTGTIRVAYSDICLTGPQSAWEGGSPFNDRGATIVADFSGDLFELDADYYPYNFSLSYLALIKIDGSANAGTGIAVSVPSGTNWLNGLALKGCRIRFFYDGVNIVGALGSHAGIRIDNCLISNNAGRAVWTNTAVHLTVSSIENSVITQNTVGGVWIGAKGMSISNNDLEGQPDPLKLHGTNSTDVVIRNNYFEGNSGEACVNIGTSSRVTVERNMWSSAPTIPYVLASSSVDIRADVPVTPVGCHNVQAPSFSYDPPGDYISESWNANATLSILPVQTTSGISITRFGTANTADVFARNLHGRAYDITATHSTTGTSGTFNIAPNDVVGVSIWAKYTDTAPSTQMVMVIRGYNGATYDLIASVGFASSGVQLGDSVRYFAAAKNLTVTTYTKIQVQFYPFGSNTSYTGTGVLSLFLAWISPSSTVRPLDACAAEDAIIKRVTGVAVPAAGTWGTGDIVWNLYPSVATLGWVCTTGGTPGTWAAFGVSRQVSVPATATSTGAPGDWAADSSYHYVCYATNTWRRVAVASW